MNLQSPINVSPINVNNQQTCSCPLCAARATSTNVQSPINIDTTKCPSLNLNKVLRFHYQDTYNLTFRKGGHNAHVDMTNPSKKESVFYQGKAYDFFEFHLHTTSEHTFDGQARKMELHMVHATNPNLPLDSPNGVADFGSDDRNWSNNQQGIRQRVFQTVGTGSQRSDCYTSRN